MTPHRSQAYVRHITLTPAANICNSRAIIFLLIKARIWHHICWNLDQQHHFVLNNPYDVPGPDDQRFRQASRQKLCNKMIIWYNHSNLWQIVWSNYITPIVISVAPCLLWFHGVLLVNCAIKSEPYTKPCGCEKWNLFLHQFYIIPLLSS